MYANVCECITNYSLCMGCHLYWAVGRATAEKGIMNTGGGPNRHFTGNVWFIICTVCHLYWAAGRVNKKYKRKCVRICWECVKPWHRGGGFDVKINKKQRNENLTDSISMQLFFLKLTGGSKSNSGPRSSCFCAHGLSDRYKTEKPFCQN